MADIKLFNISSKVTELKNSEAEKEKELQNLIEKNMQTFFSVKFLASEFIAGDFGRMDSIGIDENYSPVIFEYKRAKDVNVINQGVAYLNWLLEHKEKFVLLAQQKFGDDIIEKIDWAMPRIVCIASNFSRYDERMIKSLTCNISLIRYKKYGDELILFEQLNQNVIEGKESDYVPTSDKSASNSSTPKTFAESFNASATNIVSLYNDVKEFILSLGEEVCINILKRYVAFRKIDNFVCLTIHKEFLHLYLKIAPDAVQYEEGFSRDVSKKGHLGGGGVEITIKNDADFEKAKIFIERAYSEN